MPSPVMRAIMSIMQKTASAGTTYATWNPSDKSANMSLSVGNLLAFPTAVTEGVRSTLGKSAGKWYWEYIITAAGGAMILGVGLSGSTLTNQLGNGNSGCGYDQTTGTVWYNFGTVGASASYVGGDIIGIALDMTANTVAFYKNNTFQRTATITAGTWFAQFFGNTGDQVTANFGATALAYSPPSGFNAGLYV